MFRLASYCPPENASFQLQQYPDTVFLSLPNSTKARNKLNALLKKANEILTILFDHDVTDGAPVVRFIQRLKEPLEGFFVRTLRHPRTDLLPQHSVCKFLFVRFVQPSIGPLW